MNGCSSCGACCTFITLQVNPQYRDPDIKRWIELHDIKLIEKDGGLFARIGTPCSKLRKDNLCGIYEDRPNVCRSFPASQADIDDLHKFLGEEACTVEI